MPWSPRFCCRVTTAARSADMHAHTTYWFDIYIYIYIVRPIIKYAHTRQMVRAFQDATLARVPYRIVGRRPGDVAVCYADPSKVARADMSARHSMVCNMVRYGDDI